MTTFREVIVKRIIALALSGAWFSLIVIAQAQAEAPPTIDAFARLPQVRDVTVSPDGSQIAYISALGDNSIAVTVDLRHPDEPLHPLMRSEPGKYEIKWCNWANDTRLLCGLMAMAREPGGLVYPITRLVAVNADGSKLKVLLQNSSARGAQLQDRILDWTPNDPDTVLIQLDDDMNGFPSVFKMDVNNGSRKPATREHWPIRNFITDAAGNVRLGTGYGNNGTTEQYFARLEESDDWQRLAKVKAFEATDVLEPVAMAPGTNMAYATGNFEGRSALWKMDLTDQKEPELVFSHPLVDASRPQFTSDGRLLGIWYELDRPFIFYTDELSRSVVAAMNKAQPSTFNFIADRSRDEKTFVIHSYSDVDDGTYFVLDTVQKKLRRIGTAYPELDPQQLGRMRSISYKAADGTEIPGYLTVPVGKRAENLPLIVMPHGGPIARDSWDFFFLRSFLVSRGYAVLQMNFRGSSGYGSKWYFDAHQDWGGVTYSDITDGARWAVAEGIADPKRMCIVGWSFGGYAALLGAVRNSDLYRCSVSIAGVSDLNLLVSEARFFIGYGFAREQIGTDHDKLREDSPLRHVDQINIPVLMVHGDRDYQVDVDHTRKMDSAMKRTDKPHRAVYIDDATHQLDRKSDRVTLLTEVEKFLLENLGPGV
jgi:dipeptidyl aminopeptidase/acylaminoacyl peptidase